MKEVNVNTIKRGDILFADLGMDAKGSEQRGQRPVMVIQNDTGNQYAPTVIIAVISSRLSNSKLPTHIPIGVESGLLQDSIIMVEQVRTISKERLVAYIGQAPQEIMEEVDKAIQISVNIGEHRYRSHIIRMVEEKVDAIHEFEITMATCNAHGLMSEIMFKTLLSKREVELESLKSFCEDNNLDYMDYYKPYGYKK